MLVAGSFAHPADVVAGLDLGGAGLPRGRGGDDPGACAVGGRLGDGGLGGQDQSVGDDAVQERDEEHDDEGELDHLGPAFFALPPRLLRHPPRARSQGETPSSVPRAAAPTSEPISSAMALRYVRCDSGPPRCLPVHRTYGPFRGLTRDAASENGQKDLCTLPLSPSYPPTEPTAGRRLANGPSSLSAG